MVADALLLMALTVPGFFANFDVRNDDGNYDDDGQCAYDDDDGGDEHGDEVGPR